MKYLFCTIKGFSFDLDVSTAKNESSTLPSKTTSAATELERQDLDLNKPDSSWPFRSQSTDRSLIRRSMHLYLESAHNANQGKVFKFLKFHNTSFKENNVKKLWLYTIIFQ